MGIERDPADPVALGDAAHGYIGVAQQRPDLADLFRPKLGRPAAFATAGTSGGKARAGALAGQVALELSGMRCTAYR